MTMNYDELRQAEAAATPGPWESQISPYAKGDPSNGPCYDVSVRRQGVLVAHISADGDSVSGADAELIVLMRNNFLALLAENAALRAALENVRACNLCPHGREVRAALGDAS